MVSGGTERAGMPRDPAGGASLDASYVYALLREACGLLDAGNEHAMAAHVGHAMAMMEARYGVGRDHLARDDVAD